MDAKAIMIASFATSEGWKLKIPIWIQRFAPYPSVPNSATRISRNTEPARIIMETPRQI